jgi:hypothetical protein
MSWPLRENPEIFGSAQTLNEVDQSQYTAFYVAVEQVNSLSSCYLPLIGHVVHLNFRGPEEWNRQGQKLKEQTIARFGSMRKADAGTRKNPEALWVSG